MPTLTRAQGTSLVVLRTLIGWHFLYEGYFKLASPGWSRAGVPLARWSAAGYLSAATGPFGGWFHALAPSSSHWIDLLVPIALVLVGLSLMLGALTRWGCVAGMAMLTLFYLSAVPTTGAPVTGQEGTYLLVSKNLIELAAVAVVFTFRTERIAGLDLLRVTRRAPARPPQTTTA